MGARLDCLGQLLSIGGRYVFLPICGLGSCLSGSVREEERRASESFGDFIEVGRHVTDVTLEDMVFGEEFKI